MLRNAFSMLLNRSGFHCAELARYPNYCACILRHDKEANEGASVMARKNEFGLTPNQHNFTLKYVECGNASEAYRHSYSASKMSQVVVANESCKLLKSRDVAVMVAKLQKEAKERSEITVDKKKAWLEEVIERSLQHESARDEEGNAIGDYKFDATNVVKAINELNKMDGDHAPVKNANTNKSGEDIPNHVKVEYVSAK